MVFKVSRGTLEEAVKFSFEIPEFRLPYTLGEYMDRIGPSEYLCLVAKIHNHVVGFEIGYDRYEDGSFYSWMGGVHPDFRRQGIFVAL